MLTILSAITFSHLLWVLVILAIIVCIFWLIRR